MKKNPHILIAGQPEHTQNYQNAMASSGFSYEATLNSTDYKRFDGLLLPGGGDIDPLYYNCQNQGSHSIHKDLDEAQFNILEYFVHNSLPILGICRGIQLINVYFGGTLIQDLATSSYHTDTKEDVVHTITVSKDSYLHQLYGNAFSVNSSHHQAIADDGIGHDLIPIAYSVPDNIIEAVKHSYLPIYGVQWHPERMSYQLQRKDTVNGAPLFEFFKNTFLPSHLN